MPWKIVIKASNRTVIHGMPHLKEKHGQASHRFSPETNPGIFPVAIGRANIKVLIGQIIASGKTDLSIYYRNFSMIPIIHKEIDKRYNRVKNPALNTAIFQFF